VALLATIGPALTFVGINPFWEKAIQGAIILAALTSDFLLGRVERMRVAHQVLINRDAREIGEQKKSARVFGFILICVNHVYLRLIFLVPPQQFR
jgi:hypothetical protein